MIIVDDKLSLDALAGHLEDVAPVATTWSFHFRLLRALRDGSWGALSAAATDTARRIAAEPPSGRLVVLDPRAVTGLAAALAAKHRLNLLAAELVAAAVQHRASVRLSAQNVGRRWPEVMAAEHVMLDIV